MTVEIVREALLWCFIINVGLLLCWFLLLWFVHDWVYRVHSKWFRMSVETFDGIHYAGMALFKTAIIFLNLVPFVALCIAG
jgi:hypothetical protein